MLLKERHELGSNAEKIKFADEPTRKKVGQHLSNIHDVITEEDIRNARTDIGFPPNIKPTSTPERNFA